MVPYLITRVPIEVTVWLYHVATILAPPSFFLRNEIWFSICQKQLQVDLIHNGTTENAADNSGGQSQLHHTRNGQSLRCLGERMIQSCSCENLFQQPYAGL
jgi:hypothetical protein